MKKCHRPSRRFCPRALALLMLPTVYGEVGGDGLQAFVVVRSTLLDADLDLENEYRGLGARPVGTETGEATSHLPVGLALMWAVPFAAAHAALSLLSALGAGVTADGFSIPYRSAVTAGTYVGEGLDVLDAIVDGNVLVNVRLGASVRIDDGLLLAGARRAPQERGTATR